MCLVLMLGKQKDYLLQIYAVLKDFCKSEPVHTMRLRAYWYMDDGTLNGPGCIFCTECFSNEVILRLKYIFKKNEILI